MSGKLYICGTPIGNLEDMTMRSIRILKESDYIVAEDTRHTLKLTNYFEIDTKGKLISYHQHNMNEKGIEIINLLQEDKNIALVTDAGMPCISDPGYELVKLCYDNCIPVTSAPGPTAVITGLVLSGLPTRSYVFDGFLPINNKKRSEILDKYKEETRTIIIYEAPHHIIKTLKELEKVIDTRQVAIVREITKKFEEVIKGSCSYLLSYFEEAEPRGEMVVVIEGADSTALLDSTIKKWNEMPIDDHIELYLSKGLSQKDAIKKVAKDKGVGKSQIYNTIMKK